MRRLGLLGGFLLVAVACEDKLNGPGACPDFCPPTMIQILDTLLIGHVERDSSFRGYVQAHEGLSMQISGSGAASVSRGVVRFVQFAEMVPLAMSAVRLPVAQLDSFRIDLLLQRRNTEVTGLEVALHRLPPTVDSLDTFADLDAFFADSTLIGTIPVADTASSDSSFNISGVFPGDAFPTFELDDRVIALGLSVRADGPSFVTLGATEGGVGALIQRFVQVESGDTLAAATDAHGPAFDTFLVPPVADVAAGTLAIGGSPTARALLRTTLPSVIIDSSDVVRAMLSIVPVGPATGAPSDTFRVEPNALGADFGPKSPLVLVIPNPADSLGIPGTRVSVGSADTVEIDITTIVRSWQADSSRPRSFMLRLVPEGGSIAELRIGSSGNPGAQPALRITYVPPFRFEGR